MCAAAIGQKVQLPQGYFVQYGGQFESQEKASRQIMLLSHRGHRRNLPAALYRAESVALALLVMANLPLALIGGVVMVFLSGGTLSIASLVGFITLFGIATRNGIMLISHYSHLMTEEGVGFRDAIVQGSMERLSPILMTALVTGVGLIPLALGVGQPGKEIQQPMAVVILGGIVTSTFLNMIVIPALYLKYGRAESFANSRLFARPISPPKYHLGPELSVRQCPLLNSSCVVLVLGLPMEESRVSWLTPSFTIRIELAFPPRIQG